MIVLLGDFSADLLKYDHDEGEADFLDVMYSKLLLPNISSPTQITSTSATLIDKIFTNDYDNTFMSGNLNSFVRSSCSNFDNFNTKYNEALITKKSSSRFS